MDTVDINLPTDKVVQDISAKFKAFSGLGYSFSNSLHTDLTTQCEPVLTNINSKKKRKKLVPKVTTVPTFKAFSGIGNKLNS